jgi:hypothetical protein
LGKKKLTTFVFLFSAQRRGFIIRVHALASPIALALVSFF